MSERFKNHNGQGGAYEATFMIARTSNEANLFLDGNLILDPFVV